MSQYSTIRLVAPNDTYGNPRGVFVVFQGGNPVAAYVDGYLGEAAITNEKHRKAYKKVSVPTKVKTYKEYEVLSANTAWNEKQ